MLNDHPGEGPPPLRRYLITFDGVEAILNGPFATEEERERCYAEDAERNPDEQTPVLLDIDDRGEASIDQLSGGYAAELGERYGTGRP